jgi:hypothetical protein
MAKLHEFLACPTIDKVAIVLNLVVMHNEEGVFQLRDLQIGKILIRLTPK